MSLPTGIGQEAAVQGNTKQRDVTALEKEHHILLGSGQRRGQTPPLLNHVNLLLIQQIAHGTSPTSGSEVTLVMSELVWRWIVEAMPTWQTENHEQSY